MRNNLATVALLGVGLFSLSGDEGATTFSDQEASRRIRELEASREVLETRVGGLAARLTALEDRVGSLSLVVPPGLRGEAGPPGNNGTNGADGKDGVIRVEVHREGRLSEAFSNVRTGSAILVKVSRNNKE